MTTKWLRLALIWFSGILLCAAGVFLYFSWPHLAEEGAEVTPARYSAMRERWAAVGPDHYRLVASYQWEIVGGCSEDVEVQNEGVIAVYRSDCRRPGILTVSEIFDMFQDFVGFGRTRPAVGGERCMNSYVTAAFDRATGYPHYMESHLISVPARGLYFSLERQFSSFSCLATLPPKLTATIESLTPLE